MGVLGHVSVQGLQVTIATVLNTALFLDPGILGSSLVVRDSPVMLERYRWVHGVRKNSG